MILVQESERKRDTYVIKVKGQDGDIYLRWVYKFEV